MTGEGAARARRVGLPRALSSFLAVDLLVALLLLLISALPAITQRCPLLVFHTDEFDDSWGVDLVHRALDGQWLGRDAFYMRGPLFQLLMALPGMTQGESLCTYYRYLWMLQYWSVVIPLFFASRMLLRHQPAWKRAALLAVVTIFWVPLHGPLSLVRVTLPLCALAAFILVFEKLEVSRRALWLRGAAISTLLAVSFLLSMDSGMYSLIALIAVALSALFYPYRAQTLRRMAALFGMTACFSLGWTLLINAWAARPFDFAFWRTSSLLLDTYRWSESSAMNATGPHPTVEVVFVATCSVCFILFVLEFICGARGRLAPQNRGRLFAMAIFSIAVLESGVVQAEWFHVLYALFPMIVLAFAILLGAARLEGEPLRPTIAVLAMLVITGGVSGPEHHFVASNVARMIFSRADQGCPSGTQLFEGVCLEREQGEQLRDVSGFIGANSSKSDSVLVYPQENIFAVAAGRNVAGTVLQNYLVVDRDLARLQLQSLTESKPALAVYDSSSDWQGIPSFTRSPDVWLFAQKHYRAERQFGAMLVLRRDDERAAAIELEGEKLPVRSGGVDLEPAREVNLSSGTPAAADFLQIELKLDYPWYWRLLKPAGLMIHLRFEDASDALVPFIAPPNEQHSVWINPRGESALTGYFDADPAKWHSGPPTRITAIGLIATRTDWASVPPRGVTVTAISAETLLSKPPAGRQQR